MKKQYLFFISGALLIIAAVIFVKFLAFHEVRVDASGWLFNDPIFHLLPRWNCSLPIFSITYGSLILYVILERKKELFLSKLMLAYALLLLFRVLTLSLLPLKESEVIIFLQDPFLNNLIYPGEIDSDLFFSGHTGLILVFFFLSRKWIFAISAAVIGLLLMIQRVHYSIDILGALPFSYLIVKIVSFISNKVRRVKEEQFL